MKKKIGIYGGSFNPIHTGHLKVIEFVMKQMKLDKLIVVPVGVPSHRTNNLLDGEKRLQLAKEACKGIPGVEVSDIEVRNREVSYTYDTLLDFKKNYKNADFYEIIGEDSAAYLHKWKDYEKMLKECNFVVLKREGYSYTTSHRNVTVLESPLFLFSSTEIRERLREGKDIGGMVPDQVKDIIEKEHFYK